MVTFAICYNKHVMTSIKDFIQKIKLFFVNIKDKHNNQSNKIIASDLYVVLIIILVGIASFGLGKISSYEKNKIPISIQKTQDILLSAVSTNNSESKITETASNKGLIVASKSGTKYYYPWCSGVSRIKEENKVWFNTIEEARAKGLTPASNCTGLK